MMKKRAQAAMEFLMTYGWAILVVLLAIGALAYFGVLDPGRLLPESTTFPAPIANADRALIDDQTNSVEVALINNQGFPIQVLGGLNGAVTPDASTTCDFAASEDGGISVTYNGNSSYTGQIPNGATFLLRWDCDDITPTAPDIGTRFKATLSFDYTNIQTGQTRSHIGTVQGRYE